MLNVGGICVLRVTEATVENLNHLDTPYFHNQLLDKENTFLGLLSDESVAALFQFGQPSLIGVNSSLPMPTDGLFCRIRRMNLVLVNDSSR